MLSGTRLTLGEQVQETRQGVDTRQVNDEHMPLVLVDPDGLLQPGQVPFGALGLPYLDEGCRVRLEEPAKGRTVARDDVICASGDRNNVLLAGLAILTFVRQPDKQGPQWEQGWRTSMKTYTSRCCVTGSGWFASDSVAI